jgi:hypothetical protein
MTLPVSYSPGYPAEAITTQVEVSSLHFGWQLASSPRATAIASSAKLLSSLRKNRLSFLGRQIERYIPAFFGPSAVSINPQYKNSAKRKNRLFA